MSRSILPRMEWLDKGRYTYELLHPPFGRVMSALGPYLTGIRGVENVSTYSQVWDEGNEILHARGAYEKNLTLARLGILPFFIIASLVVALWAKSLGGATTSLLATLLFTTLPPILAHSGFATPDMACTALVAASLFSLTLWLIEPTLLRSSVLGIAVGLAVLSRLTAGGFLLVGGGLIMVLFSYHRHSKRIVEMAASSKLRRRLATLSIALLLCILTIWAGYRFSIKPLASLQSGPYVKVDYITGSEGMLHDAAYFILENFPIIAPEFLMGIDDFFDRNRHGHLAYLGGDIRIDGWWYFFPVVFMLKTPLPFILLGILGLFFTVKDFRANINRLHFSLPAIAAIGILAISTLGNINNGLRHILSIYPLLAITAGFGAAKLILPGKRFHVIGLGLVTMLFSWQVISSIRAHPDYMAYFNELAGSHPEGIVVDGDLDWGQDLKRLALTIKKHGIKELKIKYNGSRGIDLTRFDFPPMGELKPYRRETGWIAISILNLKLGTREAPYDQFSWLREYEPVEQVGKSIWLYCIPGD